MDIIYVGLIASAVALFFVSGLVGLRREKLADGASDRIAGNRERQIALQAGNVAARERIAAAIEQRRG